MFINKNELYFEILIDITLEIKSPNFVKKDTSRNDFFFFLIKVIEQFMNKMRDENGLMRCLERTENHLILLFLCLFSSSKCDLKGPKISCNQKEQGNILLIKQNV